MKKSMNDNLMEIIVDKDGFCHLYVNGQQRRVTYLKFEMDADDMLPKLETKEYMVNHSEDNKIADNIIMNNISINQGSNIINEISKIIEFIRDEVNAPHSNGNSRQTIKVSKVNKILDSVLEEYGIINKK